MSRLDEITRELALKSIMTLYRHTAYWTEQNDLSLIVNAYFDITEGVGIERIRQLAQADKSGRVAVFPIKPGETVYVRSGCLFYKCDGPLTPCKVVNIRKGTKGGLRLYLRPLCEESAGTNYHRIFPASAQGLTFWLTREEAEAALRKDGK